RRLAEPPQPRPTSARRAGEEVQVFIPEERPRYDPETQKAVIFKGTDRQTYVALVPKDMNRADAVASGRAKLANARPVFVAERAAARQPQEIVERGQPKGSAQIEPQFTTYGAPQGPLPRVANRWDVPPVDSATATAQQTLENMRSKVIE